MDYVRERIQIEKCTFENKCLKERLFWQEGDFNGTRVQRYPKKKLCIIWDNAAWHRSKGLRKLLGKGNEFAHITLIWMPPYAPDENPEEHVWKFGKEAIANEVYATFAELKKKFETAVNGRLFSYQIPCI